MTWLWLLLAMLFEIAPDGDDDNDSDADTDAGDDDDSDVEYSKSREVRDPRKKIAALQDHIDRLHRRIKERDQRIEELGQGASNGGEALRSARIEVAFMRSVFAMGQRIDAETTYDLLKVRGFIDLVNVDDDGAVNGMDEALAGVLDRYPWLTDFDGIPDGDLPPPSGGRKTKQKASGPDDAGLKKRFPALSK